MGEQRASPESPDTPQLDRNVQEDSCAHTVVLAECRLWCMWQLLRYLGGVSPHLCPASPLHGRIAGLFERLPSLPLTSPT